MAMSYPMYNYEEMRRRLPPNDHWEVVDEQQDKYSQCRILTFRGRYSGRFLKLPYYSQPDIGVVNSLADLYGPSQTRRGEPDPQESKATEKQKEVQTKRSKNIAKLILHRKLNKKS